MKLIKRNEIKPSVYLVYEVNRSIDVREVLRATYLLAENSAFAAKYITVDEPSGVDSSWNHFKGALTQGLQMEEFIHRYSCYDITECSCRGHFDNNEFSVGLYPGNEITVSCKVDVPQSSLDRFCCFVETIIQEAGE